MAAPSVTCPPGQVPGGSGCDAAATRQRASGGVLAENPADAQRTAPTVDCDLHHTPVCSERAPRSLPSTADTLGSARSGGPQAVHQDVQQTAGLGLLLGRWGHGEDADEGVGDV